MPFTEILNKARLADIHSIRSTGELLTFVQGLDLQVGDIPQGYGFFHGLEDASLYDRDSNTLFQRQWFTRSARWAQSYASATGVTFSCITVAPLHVVRLPQAQIVHSPQFKAFIGEVAAAGYRIPLISQWDMPEVGYKRWYLLDLVRCALDDQEIQGWIDNPDEDLEMYVCDVAGYLQIEEVQLTGNEEAIGEELGW